MLKSLLTLVGCLMLVATAAPQQEAAQELTGIKCVVRGQALKNKNHKVSYKDGEVYVCCEQCVQEFAANTKEYATKANHQLVATGQYVQKVCPVSGQPVSEGFATRIAAVEVGLHCQDCVDQLANIQIPKHVYIFGEDNFRLTFVSKAMAGNAMGNEVVAEEAAMPDKAMSGSGTTGSALKDSTMAGSVLKDSTMAGSVLKDSEMAGSVLKDSAMAGNTEIAEAAAGTKPVERDLSTISCLMMDDKKIVPESGIDYLEGKVYFCCESCQDEFRNNTAKYAQQANQQLVESGQYVQHACPFSGKEVDPEMKLEIDGIEIGFSSSNYLDIAKSAADDDVRAELVFNAESFEMGFKKK